MSCMSCSWTFGLLPNVEVDFYNLAAFSVSVSMSVLDLCSAVLFKASLHSIHQCHLASPASVCVLAGNVSKPRRCSSQEGSGQAAASVVVMPNNSVYSDSSDVGGRHAVNFSVSGQSVFGCRSAASGDASAAGMRTADDKSVVAGACI